MGQINAEDAADAMRPTDAYPQNGAVINDFNSYAKDFSLSYGVKILRVDLLDINTEIIKGVVARTI